MDRSAPVALGSFDLLKPLGHGGMGQVYAGRERATGRPVAVKVLRGDRTADARFRRAFDNEVEALRRLDHPGFPAVVGCGAATEAEAAAGGSDLGAGNPYVAMELLGISLARRCGKLPWARTRGVLLALLDALGHAHRQGVLHRDVKPANVLFRRDGGGPKLVDLGVARILGAEGADYEDTTAGTPPFMAPEQLAGEHALEGPPSDLYQLGCLAYALVTGIPPFGKQGSFRWFAMAHRMFSVPRIDRRIEVPRGFRAWLHGLLAKDPRSRYQDAEEAAEELALLPDVESCHPVMEEAPWPPAEPDAVDGDGPPSLTTVRERGSSALRGAAAR